MMLLRTLILWLIISAVKVADLKSRKKPDYSGRSKEISCDCSVDRTTISDLEYPVQQPWMVALFYDGSFQCAGVIVDTQYILTAAHCFHKKMNQIEIKLNDEEKLRRFKVIFNTNFTEKLILGLRITKLVVHKDYSYNDGYTLNDAALVKLSRPLIFTNGVQSICLAQNKSFETDKVIAQAYGWGSTTPGGAPSPVLKKKLSLPIVSNKECYKMLDRNISESNICAGGQKGNDLCRGDSGTALFVTGEDKRFYLVGISSWGVGCGTKGMPGVYTRISYHAKWIRENSADSPLCESLFPPLQKPNFRDCGIPEIPCPKNEPACQSVFDYSWMAKIFRNEKYQGSGVLVHRSHVLTSSSVANLYNDCIKDSLASKNNSMLSESKYRACKTSNVLKVQLGMQRIDSKLNTSISSTVVSIFCHESRICVLKLQPEMDYLSLLFLHPVCLPTPDTNYHSKKSKILLKYWKKKKDNSYPDLFVATPCDVKPKSKCKAASNERIDGKICTCLRGKHKCPETGAVVTSYKAGRYYLLGFLSPDNQKKCSRMQLFDLIQENAVWIRNIIKQTAIHPH